MKPLWWIPVMMCFIAGFVFLIPVGDASGPTLAYDAVVPLAPLSSILMWILGILIYALGRRTTGRPLRPM
ncbi:MAG: hypothetical protein V3R87_07200 [Dehalococcoidia bacterium]